ncbi:hypothetical protein [Variovorax paradoxus]|uniref:hypothetical protein n=1 Tax=Variovorax paradoxus TaxID=34073 RepID=UPI003D65ECD6
MCVIKIAEPEFNDTLVAAMARSVRGHHADGGRLDVIRVECGSAADPLRALLQGAEINPELRPFEARAPLADFLADRSALFVISEAEPVSPREWELFVNVVEHFGKAQPALRLCVAVLDHRGVVPSQPAFDFTAGRATHFVLTQSFESEEFALWTAYLHHRASWECAGRPSLAQQLGAELTLVRHADDAGVEKALCDFALREASNLGDLAELSKHIQAAMMWRGAAQAASKSSLQQSGLLWRPPGLHRLDVVPWLSRALLCSGKASDQMLWNLRHNLVCSPLAGEILAQCLSAESRIRMQLHGQESTPGDTTLQAYQRFTRGEDRYIVYPPGYPSPPSRPQDAWAFGGLGATLRSSTGNVPEAFWDTLHLRNAIAHGHYVAWTHVRRAWQQLRRFDV